MENRMYDKIHYNKNNNNKKNLDGSICIKSYNKQ